MAFSVWFSEPSSETILDGANPHPTSLLPPGADWCALLSSTAWRPLVLQKAPSWLDLSYPASSFALLVWKHLSPKHSCSPELLLQWAPQSLLQGSLKKETACVPAEETQRRATVSKDINSLIYPE